MSNEISGISRKLGESLTNKWLLNYICLHLFAHAGGLKLICHQHFITKCYEYNITTNNVWLVFEESKCFERV